MTRTGGHRRRLLAAVALLTVVAAACGDDDGRAAGDSATPGSDGTARDDEPTRGGTLTYATITERASLDPATMSTATEAQALVMFFNVYAALLYLDTDGTPQPLMARSIEMADDGKTWVLTLRSSLEFSDGTPLDADAVIFNWDRITDPGTAAVAAAAFANVASYEATDEVTITITLKKPNMLFASTVAGSAMSYIASPRAITERGDDFGTAPVGAGPFVLDEWVPGSHSSWSRNPSYFDADNVYLDQIEITPIADETQRSNAFETGAADIVWTAQTATADAVERADGEVSRFPLLGSLGLVFNMRQPPFDDRELRAAMVQALDADAVSHTYRGQPDPVGRGLLSPSSPVYDGDAEFPAVDLEAAQATINDFVRQHGTIEARLLVTSGTPAITDAAAVIKEQLERLDGVTVTIETVDQSALVATLRAGDFDLAFWGLPFIAPDPGLYDTFHSAGAANHAGYSNKRVDAALERARATSDPAEQQDAFDTVQQTVADDAFLRPVANSTYILGSSPRVHLEVFGDSTPRTDRIWISEE